MRNSEGGKNFFPPAFVWVCDCVYLWWSARWTTGSSGWIINCQYRYLDDIQYSQKSVFYQHGKVLWTRARTWTRTYWNYRRQFAASLLRMWMHFFFPRLLLLLFVCFAAGANAHTPEYHLKESRPRRSTAHIYNWDLFLDVQRFECLYFRKKKNEI